MTAEMFWTLALLALAIALFVTEWLRVDITTLIVVLGLMLSGVLSPAEALSGFSHPVVLTIAALFVLSGGMLQTGLAAWIGRQILRIAGDRPQPLLLGIMLGVALLSAFMSDTGTVALLLPAIVSLANSARNSPSKLLMPLAYASLLGGMSTLIGSPPNLLISDLLRENGFSGFGLFDITPLGLMLIAAGMLYMLLAGKRLLPDRQPRYQPERIQTPEELAVRYRLPENLFRLRIRSQSPLIGQDLRKAALGKRFNVSVLGIRRPEPPRTLASLGNQRLVLQPSQPREFKPDSDTCLQANDILLIQGSPTDVTHLAASCGLAVLPAENPENVLLHSQEVGLAEVLIAPTSSLIGKSIRELAFGTRYKLSVLGLYRPGHDQPLPIKDTPLRFGDTLLVFGTWQAIRALRQRRDDFIIIGEPEAFAPAPNASKAPVAAVIMLLALLLMLTNALPLVVVTMGAALAMVLSGCLEIDEAYRAIDWKSIVLVAGMLPMSTALTRTGVIDLAAGQITERLGALGPYWVLGGLFLLAAVITQVLANTTTTVLLAPLALSVAANLGIQPQPLLVAVAFGSSAAFATPMATPGNTLVMGAGDYRFGDYTRVGLPLILITFLITLVMAPLFWPFY